jgi:hypothetical protein
MTKHDRAQLLGEIRANKRNRSVGEIEQLLTLFSFEKRATSKEGALWKRGSSTVTLPEPHGKGDRSLHPGWVSLVIRKIEEAEAASAVGDAEKEEAEDDEEEEDS